MKPFTVAAAQYEVSYLDNWQAFEEKITAWVAEAVDNGAEMLLFPEYAAMELCSLFAPDVQQDLQQQLVQLQALLPVFLDLHQQLADDYAVTIIAGSFPEALQKADGSRIYMNRAYVFQPYAPRQYQDKQVMTRFEKEEWLIAPGEPLNLIDTPFGQLGICICYDSEFPLIGRQLIEMGAEYLLVPSVTETLAGFYRVRIGSQARALENQCYVVHAALVGTAPWSPAIDINTGAAGIYTPVDKGFPANGILAEGRLNEAGWVYATLDVASTQAIREQGSTLNYQDWAYVQSEVTAVAKAL